MSILLIWQEIPDNIRLFVFPVDHPDKDLILECNSQYINHNAEEGDAVFSVNDKLCDDNGVNLYKQYEVYNESGEDKNHVLKDQTITTVLVAGFYL